MKKIIFLLLIITAANVNAGIEINLKQGWNLLAYPGTEEQNTSFIFSEVNLIAVFGYEDSWKSYNPSNGINTLETVKPGYGYWVKVRNDTTWVFYNKYVPFIEERLTVHFINVSQGDSMLIAINNKTILIDAGSKSKGEDVFNYINSLGYNYLDIMIASHPHADHIGGLIYILENMPVYQVYDNGETRTIATYLEYIALATAKNYSVVSRGFNITLDENLELNVISPPAALVSPSDYNENSIIIKLTYNNVSFLFTGDCESDCEESILDSGINIDADILKVAHHGSNGASSQKFLEAVTPDIAVIEVGNNPYDHPGGETLTRLIDIGADIYLTYTHGNIAITTDGYGYSIETEK